MSDSALDPATPTCAGCGTVGPANEPACPACVRSRTAGRSGAGPTLLSWVVFLVVMGVIFGGGIWLAPT